MNEQKNIQQHISGSQNAAASPKEQLRTILMAALEDRGLSHLVNDRVCEKLEILHARLVRTNEMMNITAITELERVALLHFADSICACNSIAPGSSVIDVGCGGGFPSLPLAIVRPDLHILSLDSTAKKLTFVSEMALELELNVTTLAARAEDAAKQPTYREKFDVAVSRAVASMNVLAELCIPFVKNGGVFVALKGKDALAELDCAEKGIKALGCRVEKCDIFALHGDEQFQRGIITCRKYLPTPSVYPRPYAQIKKKPL